MPATRSRTENWRQSLQNVAERGGALEISLPGREQRIASASDTGDLLTPNLIWRVRILSISDDEIIVEQPSALGELINIRPGAEIIGIMVIGQNRWMFRTQNLGGTRAAAPGSRTCPALRLRMPDQVERCQRRNFYRVTTVGLNLPTVECYPLLDPASAAIAEADNRVRLIEMMDANISGRAVDATPEPIMPQVGPAFTAALVNIGGGGAGLVIDPDDRPRLDSERLYWLRIGLQPEIPIPVGITARLKHTHYDSAQRVYAGMAFEFGFDPRHQPFIVDLLTRYVTGLQRETGR